jgi:hypothetical protein
MIAVMLLRLPLVVLRPEQITSVAITPPSRAAEMTINYVTDAGIYRVFTVRTAQHERWRQAFAQLGVRSPGAIARRYAMVASRR